MFLYVVSSSVLSIYKVCENIKMWRGIWTHNYGSSHRNVNLNLPRLVVAHTAMLKRATEVISTTTQTSTVFPHCSPQHRQPVLFAITEQACEYVSPLLILEAHNAPPNICHTWSKNCEILYFNLSPCSVYCFLSLHLLWRRNGRTVPKRRHINIQNPRNYPKEKI